MSSPHRITYAAPPCNLFDNAKTLSDIMEGAAGSVGLMSENTAAPGFREKYESDIVKVVWNALSAGLEYDPKKAMRFIQEAFLDMEI